MLAAAVDSIAMGEAAEARDPVREQEALLVNAARNGDRAAFARLHQCYAPMVHGIALARAPIGEANDLVQEVFLDALRQLHVLRDPGSFGSWIAAIARHRAVSWRRRARSTVSLAGVEPPRSKPFGHASPSEEALRVLQAIRELPETYCETLTLRLVEGLTGPQIAACTGMTHGSVRLNLHRGMQLLRQKLGLEESS